jgi:Uma2 family endonuclease
LLAHALPAAVPPSVSARTAAPGQSSSAAILYPESDGKPMADNTKQARWMVVLFGNLSALFAEVKDVFVAMNLFWYAVQGETEERTAPDVLVVFGRPKGERGSYQQWQEGGVPVTVAFEVRSPSNTADDEADARDFYDRYGVEEYYIYNPDTNRLRIYTRGVESLRRVWDAKAFVSPRLGIRFDLSGPELVVRYPDGRPFLTFEELEATRKAAEQRADNAEQRADNAEQKLTRLAQLSRKARRGQASAEELQELERLEDELGPSA